jgi:protein-disulfide isomerase
MKRYLPVAVIVVVFLISIGAGIGLYRIEAQSPSLPKGKLAFGKPGADPPNMRGSKKAPIAVEEFGDFECIPCSQLYPVLKKTKDDYGNTISVTFREYPLPQHSHAALAARAAETASLQGRFWEMHDSLYENRLVWINATDTREALVSLAEKLGLDVERFRKDFDSDEVNTRLQADWDRVLSLELDRTPTVFINGDPFTTRPITAENLKAAIEAARPRQK